MSFMAYLIQSIIKEILKPEYINMLERYDYYNGYSIIGRGNNYG